MISRYRDRLGSYTGGKGGSGVAQTIINEQPPHGLYIEPFAGHAAVCRAKRPAARTILIDQSAAVVARLRAALSAPPGTAGDDSDTAAAAGVGHALDVIQGDGVAYLASLPPPAPGAPPPLAYCDPPYLRDTRRSDRAYYGGHEMTDADHERFLTVATRLPFPVQISGYASELYADMLAGWRTIHFQAMTRRGPATETLWMNYDAPAALHDYRHLGADYRERERIKKKAARWRANLADLPPLERQAILSAILE